MADTPRRFDDLVRGLPTFKATSKAARTRTERDDPLTIYSVRTVSDLAREVLKRASTKGVATIGALSGGGTVKGSSTTLSAAGTFRSIPEAIRILQRKHDDEPETGPVIET